MQGRGSLSDFLGADGGRLEQEIGDLTAEIGFSDPINPSKPLPFPQIRQNWAIFWSL